MRFNVFALLDEILANTATIIGLLKRPKPTRIVLAIPALTRKGVKMANFELKDDNVATITIQTADASGAIEPIPAGDVFTATSSSPSLGVSIGVDASNNPALILTPLVQVSPGITVTVKDSAGLAQAALVVDIVADTTDTQIVLNTAGAVLSTQPTPTAPGP